jgi:hypothetical protein
MKTITRSEIHLAITTIILTATLVVPAVAQQQVPFKGTFQGSDTVFTGPCPITLCTNATGTGTQLGQFSFTQELTLNPANPTDSGVGQWKAANGDIIYTTVSGLAVPGPDVFTIAEIHIITGGTGRFAGAQGSFCVFRKHVVAPSPDGTHITFGSFEGTITSPGATH